MQPRRSDMLVCPGNQYIPNWVGLRKPECLDLTVALLSWAQPMSDGESSICEALEQVGTDVEAQVGPKES
jgi:hypothetical protein